MFFCVTRWYKTAKPVSNQFRRSVRTRFDEFCEKVFSEHRKFSHNCGLTKHTFLSSTSLWLIYDATNDVSKAAKRSTYSFQPCVRYWNVLVPNSLGILTNDFNQIKLLKMETRNALQPSTNVPLRSFERSLSINRSAASIKTPLKGLSTHAVCYTRPDYQTHQRAEFSA